MAEPTTPEDWAALAREEEFNRPDLSTLYRRAAEVARVLQYLSGKSDHPGRVENKKHCLSGKQNTVNAVRAKKAR